MIRYITKVLRGMQYKNFFKTITKIHKKTNKNRFILFCDMVICFIRYGAGYHDYEIYQFYNLKHKKRNTYVTRVRNKKIIIALNNPEYSDIIDKKHLFNERFKKYLKRDTLDIYENEKDLNKFIKKHPIFFAKPTDEDSGRGIEKLNSADFKSTKDLLEYLKAKKQRVVEEVVQQHEGMNKLYPKSVNCLRILTILIDGKVEIIYGVLKTGSKGMFKDNMGFGGICAPINLKTGKLTGIGHTGKLENYDKHPDTNVKFIGFQIPMFKEAIELAKEAALEIPEIRYIGWDVAISKKGPLLIEGNDYPDYTFWQLPEHTPDRIGIWPYYKEKIKNL